jgi:arylsulfatase A
MCIPTRVSILTGKSPARLNCTEVTDWRQGRLKPQPWDSVLPAEENSLAEVLQARGYATALIGKWHVGKVAAQWPEHHGFDRNVSGCNIGAPPSYFAPYKNPRLPDGPPGEHLTDRLTDEAERFIGENKRRPFLLCLWHYAPHTPIQAKTNLVARFQSKPADGLQDDPVYAAMLTSLDESVGRVLAALDEHRLATNTVVVFTSDNGGLDRRVIGLHTKTGGPTCNAPLRAGKSTLYEGGVRVPLIVRWPGRVAPGSVSAELACSWDLYPTFLALSGAAATAPKLDGTDLTPVLTGQGRLGRDFVAWHYPHYSNYGTRPSGAIRMGDWKLLEHFEDGKLELYNLRADLGEEHDRATTEPEQARALHDRLVAWRKSVGARMPVPNPDFQP